MENKTYQVKRKSTYVMMALNLEHKKLLVVGGGPVAYKRFVQWVGRGAEIHVVAPEFCEAFENWGGLEASEEACCSDEGEVSHEHDDGRVHLHQRGFCDQDLEGVWMTYAATRDEELNETIENLCKEKGILWSRGDASDSEVQSVSMIERGSVQIGISTGGKSPAMVVQIKDQIDAAIDLEAIEGHIELMQKLKLRLKSEMPDQAQRALLLRKAAKMSVEELECLVKADVLLEFDKFFT